MATLDNERYLRHILLLGEGGLLVLRGIVTREAARRGQTLEHILETKRAVFQNLVHEQRMRLFPSTSTVNADVTTWDMSLLLVVVKRLFMGKSGLSVADISSIKTLKAYRNHIQGHPTSMSMSATDYDTNRRLLKTALQQLASGISADTDTEIKDIIRRTKSGCIDIQSSLEHIKELHEFKTSFLDTLESTDMNRRLNDIETRETKILHLVEQILKMKINDSKRNTKNALQTIIEAKCGQRQKEKEALCLLFAFVEMIQNQNDFSKEEIKRMIEQRIQWYGDVCLQLVDDLLCWFTDMRNIPDVVPGIAELGCIRIPIKCSSMKGMLKHLEYMDSDDCEQRLSEISCSLSKMFGFSCCLSWTIEPDSLQKVMKTLSEELETPYPTSKTVKIVLPFQIKSLEGLTNIWTIFEGEEANSHLTKVSETLSKIVGAKVSLTASVVMDQFTKAVYERSKGYLSMTEATVAAGGPHFTPEQRVFDEETSERVRKVQIPVDNIGGGAGADLSADDWEKIKKVRKLRELWHGRFTNRNLTTLLKHHDWDENATNLFILDALPGELRDVLGEDDWQVVENVRRNNVLRDLARLNRIGHEVRQYGCKQDDNMWWRRVPSRKPVSKCKRCKQKYEPIPREQEWGWARFECVCGHKFNAFAMMDRSLLGPRYTGKSQSLCYRCMSQICEPIHFLPPTKHKKKEREPGDGQDQRRRPRRYAHRCTAPNCFNRYMPDPRSNEPLITICVHPNSLKDKVHGFGSDRHVSKGSTVNTFLSQDDIDSYYEPSLADIDEIDIDDGNNL